MKPRLNLPALLLFAFGLGESSNAQSVLRSWTVPNGWVGADSIPDLDGDGFRELVNLRLLQPHRVWCLSGLAGTTLYSTTPLGALLQPIRTIGDVSKDGFPDFGTGGPSDGWLFDGRTGAILLQVSGGTSALTRIDDVDGDGVDDVLFGSASQSIGKVSVYSGSTFELLYTIPSPPMSLAFGLSAERLDDVDLDGVDDFAVGAPGVYTTGPPPTPGAVYIYSGRSGTLVHALGGRFAGSGFGTSIATPGDLTGDGIGDIVVGASTISGVYFFDGRTAALIEDWKPATFPGVLYAGYGPNECVGDIDGNGFGDIAFTIGRYALPSYAKSFETWVVDGATRSPIYQIPGSSYPRPVGNGIDWNDDDFPDFLRYSTILEVLSGAPIGVSSLGAVCPSVVDRNPRIGATGVANIGIDYPIHLSRVRPNAPALLITGPSLSGPIVTSKSSIRKATCSPSVAPSAIYATRTREIRPGEGAATVEVTIPNDPALQGTKFYAQWLIKSDQDELSPTAATRVLAIEIQS